MMDSAQLLLRPAAAADEFTIHRLIRQAHINPMGIRWPNFVVIESPDGSVVACGQLKPHADGTTELASIVVDPDWRSQGLARRIIEHLVADHRGKLYLMCRSSLGPLYEKFGFRPLPDGDLPRYFRRMKMFARVPEALAGISLLVMAREGGAGMEETPD